MTTPPTRPISHSTGVLLLITCAAMLVHGFHPYVEDAEIYIPGIKSLLNPALYPQNRGFFASHARLTLFPNLIAGSIRATHIPLDWGLLLWYFFSIFLLLLAFWQLGRLAFYDRIARWGAVGLVAAVRSIRLVGIASVV